jgi:molecular chaperone HscB
LWLVRVGKIPMKRIIEHRKLFNITQDTDLAQLKTAYRNLIKEWHPDKFQDNERKEEAEVKSKSIIEAYHFLVSIAPETHEQNLEEYTLTTNTSGIEDFMYKGQTLKIIFQNGSVYEYFAVPKNVYNKLVNSPTLSRFARRHIFFSYVYRNISKQVEVS